MKTKLVDRDGERRTFVVVFDVGDEVMEGLHAFARSERVDAAGLTAIGAFERAVLGYYDVVDQTYVDIPIGEQVEVLSFIGDITSEDGGPKVHAHAVVGYRNGETRGGHVLEGHVRPTLEVIITENPAHLRREHDARTGLALISL